MRNLEFTKSGGAVIDEGADGMCVECSLHPAGISTTVDSQGAADVRPSGNPLSEVVDMVL